jgi:hypothetical protein
MPPHRGALLPATASPARLIRASFAVCADQSMLTPLALIVAAHFSVSLATNFCR